VRIPPTTNLKLRKFIPLVFQRHEQGVISRVVNEAIMNFIDSYNSQEECTHPQKQHSGQNKLIELMDGIIQYLQDKYDYNTEDPKLIPEKILCSAIKKIRNAVDDRTAKKRIEALLEADLILESESRKQHYELLYTKPKPKPIVQEQKEVIIDEALTNELDPILQHIIRYMREKYRADLEDANYILKTHLDEAIENLPVEYKDKENWKKKLLDSGLMKEGNSNSQICIRLRGRASK
jgi:hypothetical protein